MVGSASAVSSSSYGTAWTILIAKMLWMTIGVVALGGHAACATGQVRRLRIALLVRHLGLLVVVLVPGIGVSAGGSSRWVGLGQFRLQPSELMKLALAMFAADFISPGGR